MNKEKIMNVGRGILAIFIYFFMSISQSLPFELLGVDFKYVPMILKVIYSIFYEMLMIALIIMVYHKLIEAKWKDMKQHHREYFQKYFKYWFLLLGLMMASNLVIMLVTNSMNGAENQNQIVEMFERAPIYTYLSAVVFAPIVEELVFRQSIRNIIPKWNILFILVSGLVFGSMHVADASTWQQFIYIIPYSIPGFIFAYVLTKTDNIFCTMGLHFVHNGILMALQTFILIFG